MIFKNISNMFSAVNNNNKYNNKNNNFINISKNTDYTINIKMDRGNPKYTPVQPNNI
ncbi:hypothetical protein DICPUDRAFT_153328 [Dictyostelium purpureum]|uniref:Uncharacterized protein n=1 Tax=Dictyostelium purpureum TaxID=5786 RepID=F0ZNM2_DICPU|nr:uncharacterized protein DICPUDRAFT_153328 [Dictyostelium purpureum]EGC34468.1 hypothetical protein DICPUDRAFT_153328 [Dictyostelium purpureum]|eukprot:XP_003289003.1 hypothetical protein DICPUDRAFT_153328 [Dictyostelium purpureum]